VAVFLACFLWFICPSTEVLQEIWPDITRKIWISFEAHGWRGSYGFGGSGRQQKGGGSESATNLQTRISL